MNPVAVMFRHLRPYHRTRLNAAAAFYPILALELFDQDENGQSHDPRADDAFQQVTLFSKAVSTAGIHRALDCHQPSALAIPGWWEPACLAALAWCHKNRVPAIVMSDSRGGDLHRSWHREWVKRRVVGLCGAALVAGTPHIDYMVELGMDRKRIFAGFDVVDNVHFATGAETARDEAAQTRARFQLPENFFLASARFIAKKNLFGLLDAYHLYHKQTGTSAWDLVVLGDGPLREQLEASIQDFGLGDHIFLPGERPYDELPAFYSLAGAFVHASTTEQWGLVVNEAMAAGLPVIVSSACGCVTDLVTHGRNGFVFDPSNPRELAERLRQITALTETLRAAMGDVSREIVARWSPQTFAAGLQGAIESALETRAPRFPRLTGIVDHLMLQTLMERPS